MRAMRASASAPSPMAGWVAYDFAVLRVVPHVHLGVFAPVGVVLHARTVGFLDIRVLTEPAELAARVPGVDAELLAHYLEAYRRTVVGDPAAGPVALAPPSEASQTRIATSARSAARSAATRSGVLRGSRGTARRARRRLLRDP